MHFSDRSTAQSQPIRNLVFYIQIYNKIWKLLISYTTSKNERKRITEFTELLNHRLHGSASTVLMATA